MLILLGDSKTNNAQNGLRWAYLLWNEIIAQRVSGIPLGSLYNYGVNFQTLALGKQVSLPQVLADDPLPDVQVALCNWGANDSTAANWVNITETQWKDDYREVINTLIAKWPNILIYLSRAWVRGRQTKCDAMAAWIADLVAEYPLNVRLGDDERVWLEGGDDGVANTVDGVHYSDAGQRAKCDAMLQVLSPLL